MSMLKQNWLLLAGLGGAGLLARTLLRRQRSIDLKQAVVLVTGGSRGLGLAIAEAFAQQKSNIVITARDEQELKAARTKLVPYGVEVLALRGDVTEPTDAADIVEATNAYFGHIDILVNNAGVIMAGPWQTLTRTDFEEAMNTMFWGLYNMTTAVLPQMSTRQSGRIVNITSIGGKVSVPHLLPYSSAKFAAVGFSEGLRAELLKDNIYVTTVAPGLMRTGSQYNAIIKGDQHQTEYSLFTLLDTLPATSTSVTHAARAIVAATQQGRAELVITIPAQLMARLHGLFPGLFAEIMGISARLLPTKDAQGTERYTGRASETSLTRSLLTWLGQRAAQNYNEHPASQGKS